jgi:hypothetical protein
VHCKNKNYDGEAGENPAGLYRISAFQYPTYAFSVAGFNMALREHYVMYYREWCSQTVPHWIRYVNENNKIIRSTKEVRDVYIYSPNSEEDEELLSEHED